MNIGIQGSVARTSYRIGADQFYNVTTTYSLSGFVPEPNDNGMSWQSFTVVIENDGGTIKHRIITDPINLALPTFSSLVSGASTTFTATPQLSAIQDFATGAGISAATTSEITFNTPAQLAAEHSIQATMMANSTGDAIEIETLIRDENVNGVQRKRLALQFFHAGGFLAYPLTAANIDAGEMIYVHCQGYIRR